MSVLVLSTSKPAQVVAPATARVIAEDATYAEILDAGLEALGEDKGGLFGCGVSGIYPGLASGDHFTGTFTVYAHRD